MIYWFFFSFSAGLLLSKAVTFAEARLLRFFRPQGATPGTQSGCLPSGHSRAEGRPQPLAPPRCCAHQQPKGRKKKQILFVGLLPESLLAPLPTWSTKICSHCYNPVRFSTKRVNTGAELFLLWGLPLCSSALRSGWTNLHTPLGDHEEVAQRTLTWPHTSKRPGDVLLQPKKPGKGAKQARLVQIRCTWPARPP